MIRIRVTMRETHNKYMETQAVTAIAKDRTSGHCEGPTC